MEDKILIQSEIDKKTKNLLQKGPIVPLIITAVCIAILSLMKVEDTEYYYVSFLGKGHYVTNIYTGWERVFTFDGIDDIMCFLIFLVGAISLLISIGIAIVYLINRKCELCITENNVKGKTLLGKEVVLPLYMISGYSTRKFLSTIAISTASGITQFSLVGNYEEIGDVLSKKINERQESTANTSTITTTNSQSNSMDDLKNLKALLDAGIITQEEFDAKKKQLLGL